MQPGGTSPEAFVAAPCLRNVSPPHSDKSLVLAITHGLLGIAEIAQQIRRLFSRIGGAGRQDISFTDDETDEEQSQCAGRILRRG